MSIKIGHASIDENGKISGGKTGDQTGKEICTRSWYSKPWNVYLECTDKALANKAADWMDKICVNDNFGYDQNERWTGYNSIKKNGFEKAKGEFDCSSLVITCYILAGLEIAPDGYTGDMRKKLLKTGKFVEYTDSSHLLKDELAKRGGIYLKEGSHVVMALEDGKSNYVPSSAITPASSKTDIKWAQEKLNAVLSQIYPKIDDIVPLSIDGSYGPKTRIAVLMYWNALGWGKDMTDDGKKIGTATRNALAEGRKK
jgi:hypothetical protein